MTTPSTTIQTGSSSSTENSEFAHSTVLLNEAIAALQPLKSDGIYIDGTFGRGGHSRLLLSQLAPGARLIAFDKDLQAIANANQITDPRFSIVHNSFATMQEELNARGVHKVDGVLLDLGISSPQVDDATRGFSFRADGPLDMRMDTTRGMSAATWLDTATEKNIEEVIRNYGEERFAFQIAKAITARRQLAPISSTRELAELVAGAVKTREKGKDPATRTFQAIRIFINKELEDLESGLTQAFELLATDGKLVAISFHSLEDRIVKQFMASKVLLKQPDRRLPIRSENLPQPQMKLLGRVKPSDDEVAANPRARSAIMRVALRLADPASESAGKAR
ncbi:16S rRNA (cytosine(1402)-N(4))-methyltransferase RsmH [Solimicrobium silvestre]|uniref:Ribosomal RNA small subunit methyltransferase H n=1 Tax=Solimicrobium silvestre TaxID=2099400 RepID=A0A2S9H5F7_9BURK|nr:16S rRNA (cytosine(1402)-N(4))-methyltransferase RsmH [Solimicrobium silvestre]PRC95212.1 16S rRNA (cytosine(1402)-N(4))-methyltransferase [Solimicrobium silvestre]